MSGRQRHTPHMYTTHSLTAFERRESVGCDEEVRGMAKRKMLGNIKFVGGCVRCVRMCNM